MHNSNRSALRKSLLQKQICDQRRSFHVRIILAFASANISVEKINNLKLKKLSEEFWNERVVIASWYRQEFIPRLYEEKFKSKINNLESKISI